MNCPGHIMIYQTRKHSYRDLPLRYAELGTVYRYERSGVLHGMVRVRGFTQDDSHIFCTREQLQDEVLGILDLMDFLLKAFGYEYVCYLATRPKEKYLGQRRGVGLRHRRAAPGARPARAALRGGRGRRRLLRAQDRRQAARRAGARVAVPDHPGGPQPAQALRRQLHRVRRQGARGRHAAPRAARLDGALRRHPHRAHRRRVPGVAGAGAGDRHPGQLEGLRLRARTPRACSRRAACGSRWTCATRR